MHRIRILARGEKILEAGPKLVGREILGLSCLDLGTGVEDFRSAACYGNFHGAEASLCEESFLWVFVESCNSGKDEKLTKKATRQAAVNIPDAVCVVYYTFIDAFG